MKNFYLQYTVNLLTPIYIGNLTIPFILLKIYLRYSFRDLEELLEYNDFIFVCKTIDAFTFV